MRKLITSVVLASTLLVMSPGLIMAEDVPPPVPPVMKAPAVPLEVPDLKPTCVRYAKIILNIITAKPGREVSRFYLFVTHWYIHETREHWYLIPAWRSIQGDEKLTPKPRYDGLWKIEWDWGVKKYCVEAPIFETIVTTYDYEQAQRPVIDEFREKYPKHWLPTLENPYPPSSGTVAI